ncbi:endo-alpha-N-acetylgalactosaminidase family protein [Lacisediminihabitans sp. FW035]
MDPLNTPRISTPTLAVRFDSRTGLPAGYDLAGVPAAFDGPVGGGNIPVLATGPAGQVSSEARLRDITVEGGRAVVRYDGGGCSFALEYVVTGSSVQVTLVDVVEADGHEVIEIGLRGILSLSDSHAGAWLAHGDGGGFHSRLSAATECELDPGDRGSFPNFSVLPLVLLGHDRAGVALEVQGYLSNTALRVSRDEAGTRATIGASVLYRVPGGAATPSLPVEQPEVARLDFVVTAPVSTAPDAAVTWIDVANVVQARMPPRSTDYFDDKLLYVALGQMGPSDRTDPANTFVDIQALVKRIWHLTDAAPQVVFVAGWSDGGHDTSYPNVSVVNPQLGGATGWQQLQRAGRELYNANVTLDDNYDDQYDNDYAKPAFDPRYLALESDGTVQAQEIWNGVDLSLITGFAKYVNGDGPGIPRADETIERYGLRDAMLIDAMSWWSIRNDWDPTAPASAVKNLREGKFALLRHFESKGIHVGSELLRYPFIGEVPFVMDGPTGQGWNGFEGTPIPLMALVYRRSLIYGAGGGGNASYPDPDDALFHNNRAAKWLGQDTEDRVITGMYYLHYLPWMLLSRLDIVSFRREGSACTIGLSEDTEIVIDGDSPLPIVRHRGVEVMRGRSVSIPLSGDRVAFYSETAATLSSPLPEGSPVRVERLGAGSCSDHPYRIEGGRLMVDVQPFIPVIARLHG